MSESLLLRLHRGQAQSLRDTLLGTPPAPWGAPEIEALARVCAGLAEAGGALVDLELRRAITDPSLDVTDQRQMRRALEDLFDGYATAVEAALRLAAKANGEAPSASAGALAQALEAFRALRQRVIDQWPVCSEEEMVQVREEIARGEYEPADVVFAKILGITKEELHERLQEHVQKRKALGME